MSKKEEMVYLFYQAQNKYPVKNDWSLTVKEDLVFFDINLTEDQISKLKKDPFSTGDTAISIRFLQQNTTHVAKHIDRNF